MRPFPITNWTLFIFCLLLGFFGRAQTIENPHLQEQSYDLSFQLINSIGADEGEPYEMFGSSANFSVSKDGDWVILDPSGSRVLVFRSDGTYIREFGKKGQGPGEFQAPSEIAIGPDNHIWVFDAMTKFAALFDMQGNWIENRALPQSVVAVITPWVLDSGALIMTTVKLDEQFQQSYILGTMDGDQENFQPILSKPIPKMDWNKMGEPGFWENFLVSHFNAVANGFPVSVPVGDGFVAFNIDKFEGTCYSASGEKLWQMSQEHKPRPFFEETKRAMCEAVYDGVRTSGPAGNAMNDSVFNAAYKKATLPDFMLPISTVFPWDRGFGVLTNYDAEIHNGIILLYSPDGKLVHGGEYDGPGNIRLIRGKELYASGLDPDDVMTFQRFQVNGL